MSALTLPTSKSIKAEIEAAIAHQNTRAVVPVPINLPLRNETGHDRVAGIVYDTLFRRFGVDHYIGGEEPQPLNAG